MDYTNDAPRPRKAPRLTEADRRAISEARELATSLVPDEVRAITGTNSADTAMIYAVGFGRAQRLPRELAAIAERLDGPAGEIRRLAEIRKLLAGFDWEHDDRQLALEAIERIAEGGTP